MRLLLFLILTSGPVLTGAQEDTSTDAEKEVQVIQASDDESHDKEPEIETPDTFEATEKLSEDIPAPFPVDI